MSKNTKCDTTVLAYRMAVLLLVSESGSMPSGCLRKRELGPTQSLLPVYPVIKTTNDAIFHQDGAKWKNKTKNHRWNFKVVSVRDQTCSFHKKSKNMLIMLAVPLLHKMHKLCSFSKYAKNYVSTIYSGLLVRERGIGSRRGTAFLLNQTR